jgi:hypothetical protein
MNVNGRHPSPAWATRGRDSRRARARRSRPRLAERVGRGAWRLVCGAAHAIRWVVRWLLSAPVGRSRVWS